LERDIIGKCFQARSAGIEHPGLNARKKSIPDFGGGYKRRIYEHTTPRSLDDVSGHFGGRIGLSRSMALRRRKRERSEKWRDRNRRIAITRPRRSIFLSGSLAILHQPPMGTVVLVAGGSRRNEIGDLTR
jgi:hypothetical protein